MGTILIVLLKLIQAKFEIQNWVAWPPRNKSEGLGPCDPRVPLPLNYLVSREVAHFTLNVTVDNSPPPFYTDHQLRNLDLIDSLDLQLFQNSSEYERPNSSEYRRSDELDSTFRHCDSGKSISTLELCACM